jgi:hypothetical protein
MRNTPVIENLAACVVGSRAGKPSSSSVKPIHPCLFELMKMPQFIDFLGVFWAIFFLSAASARANVYATDIKVNGSLSTITNSGSAPVTIAYRLNQPATLGVTVAIWQGTTRIATIAGGTSMGLNTVVWGVTNSAGAVLTSGTYSVTISAAASGFDTWQQISVDANPGNFAFDPNGIAVDDNPTSPYYGRVVLGCSYAAETATNPITGAVVSNILDGIYKMNADGSFADEGAFGYGGYTMDDADNFGTGEMPTNSFLVPWRLRIGPDDRVYMLDYSDEGAIVAFDLEVTTNQVVIDDGGADFGSLGGPHNYASNPDLLDLNLGINNFDVTGAGTNATAVWLCDGDNPPNWGIWMYHLTNGASVTTDNGTQAVATTGDMTFSSGGCTVDTNLDIFCGQSLTAEMAVYDAMEFTNWNEGALPDISGGTNEALGTNVGEVAWGYGCGVDTVCSTNPTFLFVQDILINSRSNPTIVACPMTSSGLGIRLLNATNGAIITATNSGGLVIQTLTNLDYGQVYTCAAWDNVGNLYAANLSSNVWRVWSPPGSSSNTTAAVAQVAIGAVVTNTNTFKITSIAAGPPTAGCAAVTITFSGQAELPVGESYELLGSSALTGSYAPVDTTTNSLGSGAYQFVFTNCSTEFYKIKLVTN